MGVDVDWGADDCFLGWVGWMEGLFMYLGSWVIKWVVSRGCYGLNFLPI